MKSDQHKPYKQQQKIRNLLPIASLAFKATLAGYNAIVFLLLSAPSVAAGATTTSNNNDLINFTHQQQSQPVDDSVDSAKAAEARGDIKEAEKNWEKARSLIEVSTSKEKAYAGYIYACLGRIQALAGEFKKALVSKEKAITVYESSYGPKDQKTRIEYDAIGSIFYQLGELGKAEEFFKKALDSGQQVETEEIQNQSLITISNLASVYTMQGRLDKAKAGYEKVIKELDQRSVINYELRAMVLLNLGNIDVRLGNKEKASKEYNASLSYASKIQNDIQGFAASAKEAIAALKIANGDSNDAKEILKTTTREMDGAGTIYTPTYSQAIRRMAYLEAASGHYQTADAYYQKALDIYKRSSGNDSDLGFTLLELALNKVKQNSERDAASYAEMGLQYLFDAVRREAPLLQAQERSDFMNAYDEVLEKIYSFADKVKGGSRIALLARLNRQGILEEIELRQKQVNAQSIRGGDPGQANKNLHNKKHFGLDTENDSSRDLLKKASIKEIAALIPSDGALVEYQLFKPMSNTNIGDQDVGKPRYLALVLFHDGSIQCIQIGLAAPIDELIHKALVASSEGLSDAKDLWQQVSDQVLKPLESRPYLIHQLFLSPDGELNRIPFAAISASHSRSRNPLGNFRIHQITTGRDLLRLNELPQANMQSVVIGNPSYGVNTKRVKINSGDSHVSRDLSKTNLQDEVYFSPLPGTESEANRIADILGVNAIIREKASKSKLLALRGPKILHLATHGYFFNSSMQSRAKQQQVAIKKVTDENLDQKDFKSMSGIALAGANDPVRNSHGEGILTSEEALGLHLIGTELVTISACDTGQGDVRTGEGVYGLRRALTVAGARSTLLSLWKVDDAATKEFMVRFYQRLKIGQGLADSLTYVQDEFRNGLVKGPSGTDWSHPYYWAAWQLVGDWRPIKGL